MVRVDGATLTPSGAVSPVTGADDELTVFPTPHALFALDRRQGLLARSDPETLTPQGKPYQLDAQPSPDGSVVDPDGRLWTLDHRTGDLVWFADGTRHARARAGTPGRSRLVLTDGRPALLDSARRTAELLNRDTGAVTQSAPVNLGPDDAAPVSGSPQESRLLVSAGSRGHLLVCDLGAQECTPVVLAPGPVDLGPPVEVGDRAMVPDYTTGRVWVVDLVAMRPVAERRLFDSPRRFDLLVRDGIVFYNDPNTEQAGVLDLDGRVRPITKYDRAAPGQGPSGAPTQPSPGGPHDNALPGVGAGGTHAGPPNDIPTGPRDNVPPVAGPGDTRTGTPDDTTVSIVVSPGNRGVVAAEFRFTVVTAGAARATEAQWTFGDGTAATGTAARHRWSRPGTFPVGVTVQLSTGRQATAAAEVVIDLPSAPPRIVRLVVEPEAPRVGQQVHFSAEVTGQSPRTWAWTVTSNRGVVTTSTAQRFPHVFDGTGSYTVTLTVTGEAGSDRQSRPITVTPPPREAKCGDTLTTDAILTKDLICPQEVGLTIAASNVTLDLGGRTLSTDAPTKTSKGIVVEGDGTLSNITIRNGTVAKFVTSIRMTDASDVTIANATMLTPPAEQAGYGIRGDKVRGAQIRNVSIDSFGIFRFRYGSSVTIVGSTLMGSEQFSVGGVPTCELDTSCVIQRSSLRTNIISCDVHNENGNTSITITESDVTAQQLFGLCAATIKNSTWKKLGNIFVISVTLANNTFLQQHYTQVSFGQFAIINNVFDGSANSPEKRSSGLKIIRSAHGTLTRNTFFRHRGHGVEVADQTQGPRTIEISENVFESNGERFSGRDGLHIDNVPPGVLVTVTNNHTKNNLEYGINANPGSVKDGGGNTSLGNPKGCRGVFCP
ncbi:PKD domain-containing protein [Actinosynnema sp. ALI-1.44]|uniref:PKD domain-containing protein n=1 Tax=Actinosynnema sp. ALI-1.44 TaxID=1933779 RepID=UPI00143D059C|nr:PKD domain-containing protein [Actinosynnema sp. ALI-1.44]